MNGNNINYKYTIFYKTIQMIMLQRQNKNQP